MINATKGRATAAKVLLIILLVSIAFQIGAFYQTKYQLTSPLIPESTVLHIAQPFLFTALISVACCIAALLFFFYSRYVVTIVICGVALLWQQFFYH